MQVKLIIFDLDGTLVDSIEDLSVAMNYALAKYSMPTHSSDECRAMVGHGLRWFCSQALPEDKQELIDDVMREMLSYYRENYLVNTAAFDQIDEMLALIKEREIEVAVETNKDEYLAVGIVEEIFGKGFFCSIRGAKDGIAIKPAPQVTLDIMRSCGASPDETLFVGDSDVDIKTAKASGIKSVAVTWGLRSLEQLKSQEPDYIINKPMELIDLLA